MMLMMLYFMTLSYLTHAQITKISQVGQIQVKQTLFNQTYALTFMQATFSGYYHIEVNEQSQTTLIVLYKQSSPPFYNNSSLIADKIDYNGYELNRTYHHLVIQGNVTGYLTILSNQLNVQYTLSITKSTNLPCANGCSNNGICLPTGVCSCQVGFINEDCSTPAVTLYTDNQLNFPLMQQSTYFYYQALENISIQLDIMSTASSGIRIQILLPSIVYLPTNLIYNQGDQSSEDEQYRTKLNLIQNQTIIIKITVNQYLDIYYNEFNIRISDTQSNSNIPVNMIILYVFVGLAALLFILIVIVCIKRHKAHQNIAQARVQKFEKIHPLVDFRLIPIIDGHEDIQQDECTICLGKFFVDELIRKTPCQPVAQISYINSHIFHDLCIRQWLVKHMECPNCRFDLSGKQLAVLKQQQ